MGREGMNMENEEFYKKPQKPNPQQYALRDMLMSHCHEWLTAKQIYENMLCTLWPYDFKDFKGSNFTGSVGRKIQEDVKTLNFSGEFDKMIISSRKGGYKLGTEEEMGEYFSTAEKSLRKSLYELSILKHFAHRDGQMMIPDPAHPYQREFRETYIKEKKITLSELIKDHNTVIHCPKLEQAEAYAKAMDKMGRKWANGDSYLKENNRWSFHKSKFCYRPSAGLYGSLECYKEHGFKVYEFDEVDLTK
jgi:hypothetical protein